MSMSLRWKKNPHKTGLARVAAGPRGSMLRDGETEYASVYASRHQHQVTGWYWVARCDPIVPLENTCNALVADEATAKADAMAYVKKFLKSGAKPL